MDNRKIYLLIGVLLMSRSGMAATVAHPELGLRAQEPLVVLSPSNVKPVLEDLHEGLDVVIGYNLAQLGDLSTVRQGVQTTISNFSPLHAISELKKYEGPNGQLDLRQMRKNHIVVAYIDGHDTVRIKDPKFSGLSGKFNEPQNTLTRGSGVSYVSVLST